MNRLVAAGAWVNLAINGQVVGLVQNVSFDEDFAVQPIDAIGYHGPLGYDSTGYKCSINLGAFVSDKRGNGGRPFPDGGQISLESLLPIRSDIQSNAGNPLFAGSLQLLNTSSKEILESFRGVVIAGTGKQISPNSYVIVNTRLMCIERDTDRA